MKRSRTEPLVSVVVVAYNARGVLDECLDSLLSQDHPRVEIIVVDNASTDGCASEAAGRYGKKVKVISAAANRGFGAGCNAGIAAARGEIIGLLNPDAVAERSWVSGAVAVFARDASVGMVACRVLDYDNRARIDTAGHLIYPDGLNRGRGRLEPADRYGGEVEVAFPSGSAGFYRADMVRRAGGFDESFFLYGDDADLGLTGRRLGWRCIYVPASTAYHRYSHAAGAYSALKAYHVERNRVFVLVKHFPAAAIATSPFHTARRFFWHNVSAFTGRGSSGRFAREHSVLSLYALMARAYLDAAARLPDALRARARLKALDRAGEAAFMRWLDEFGISAEEIAMKD